VEFKREGKNCIVWPMARIVGSEVIELGDSVVFADFSLVIARKRIVLGDYVQICTYASILGGEEVIIGDYSALGVGCRLFTGTEDYDTMTSSNIPVPYRVPHRERVVIGKHVTMGANSVILPGTVMGEGAVVGALSLVKGYLEPWTIYGGIPCKPIGMRNRDRVMEKVRQFESRQ